MMDFKNRRDSKTGKNASADAHIKHNEMGIFYPILGVSHW